jgi:hypothetical protein
MYGNQVKQRQKRHDTRAADSALIARLTQSTNEVKRERRRREFESWVVVLIMVAIAVGIEMLISHFAHF